MELKLTIYTDETLTDVERVVEADKLKIPYRVSMYLLEVLDDLDMENDKEIISFVSKSTDKVDKILKATFGLKDSELDCIDSVELISAVRELVAWAVKNISSLKGKEKNA